MIAKRCERFWVTSKVREFSIAIAACSSKERVIAQTENFYKNLFERLQQIRTI